MCFDDILHLWSLKSQAKSFVSNPACASGVPYLGSKLEYDEKTLRDRERKRQRETKRERPTNRERDRESNRLTETERERADRQIEKERK